MERQTFDRIPKLLRLNKELKADEKLLLSHIYSLQFKQSYCHASNEYFSKQFDFTKRTITRKLKSLEEQDYIKVTTTQDSYDYSTRHIEITEKTKKIFKGLNDEQ